MASDIKKARPSSSSAWSSRKHGEPRILEMSKVQGVKAGSKRSTAVTVRFGSVTLTGDRPSAVDLKDKVKRGQRAFAKAAVTLTKSGVKLKHPDNIPVYHADPKDPKRVIRVLNGKTESGQFVGATFRPARP